MANLQDLKFYLDELKSNECGCGKVKQPNFSFCYRCYSALPVEMQRALYKHITQGYAEAYEEALEYLKERVWSES